MHTYDHRVIEKKWQNEWAKKELYKTPDTAREKENYYLLVEFPYPSGNLHVGHWYAFSVPDILARALRMQGQNVLFPIGFDAFGLPAENAAIKNKLNPRKWTEKNIAYMKKQIRSMGASFDWSREVVTCDPAYYKWTQWQFLQLFKKGLAYQKETPVNWCPKDKTVLANEQVIDGKCERCDSEVVQKEMLQWNVKITDYADRLIDDLEPLDWPREIKESQKNWIGRSEGAEIDFPLEFEDKTGTKPNFLLLHGYKGSARGSFKPWLKAELEKRGYAVQLPDMPNSHEPKEQEQVQYVIDNCTIDEHTIIVGHSLGCVVAMKLLQRISRPIAGLVLVASAIEAGFPGTEERPFWKNFSWDMDYGKLKSLTSFRIVISDTKEKAKRGTYLAHLAGKLNALFVEGAASVEHFNGEIEPLILPQLLPHLSVFTTRPDTLFGATYLVLSPEHPWVKLALEHRGLLKNESDVARYIVQAAKKTELERLSQQRNKSGVRLEGVEAINPATEERIPLFVADYVLSHYGTGAIMAVPAHDERDFDFAKKFGLPIRQVIAPVVRSTTGIHAVRENEPAKERDAVMCIVKHWNTNEFLCIQWKEFPDVRSMVSGGIEEGENLIDTGKREIYEETGYKHAKYIRQVGGFSFVEFYHQLKKTNVCARFRYLYFELEDSERDEISEEESKKHVVLWKKKDEMLSFLNLGDKEIVWSRFLSDKDEAYTDEGRLVNSNDYDGMPSEEAQKKITEQFGRPKKTYKLRDWIVSRQRYWGVPIPIVHCQKCGPVAVPDRALPVLLPAVKDYLPSGEGKSPLAKAKQWVKTNCPRCGGRGERETDTLDTFVDSSWYFLRYTDPRNRKRFAGGKRMANWMPIDLYSGGAEHTTMHVLYSRFWHKALYDLGLVADSEPYTRRMNRSLILGPDGQKMSKSRGNVVDPDSVVARLGADTVRMYLAFIGPYNEVSSYPWNPAGVVGVRRFLERVWRAQRMVRDEDSRELDVELHRAIKKVTEDIAALKFNTAVSALMIFLNAAERAAGIGKRQWRAFITLLAPFCPHIAEELWHLSGQKLSVHRQRWPEFDPAMLESAMRTLVVQVNGKVRSQIQVAADASENDVTSAARASVAEKIAGVEIVRTIVVPGRLVNFVVKK